MTSLLLQTIKLVTALITLFSLSPFFGAIGALSTLGFLVVLLIGLLVAIAELSDKPKPR
ncbi:hypothetical protein O4N70_16100 [Vibrio parahaemolyticus]|uniref:hypothetical protein n=1 Tax=Vibrio parahaemolyticus TaxID=670 RepID=UPI0022B3B078|nr:hypothetical protein [Vibrio parahaemolyticus]MCZ6415580.1 hypothetical protein [Vibrio parahaemolyticus]MCZ6421039.1 hypothetical protein [Vibrio parahaemolyticus]MDF4859326.1 hypothetical protein [Vibrio parahaemolyticus]MDF5211340.1 hypothetical protein [Vibrio parahaemolyticus]MDG2711322.1 hypothetical protein [Vibrio parahaemolyticus]